MELILWRHAEADEGWPDEGRRLTPKGRKQADRVGRWLRERVGDEYRLLSSPATRARETAEGLAEGMEVLRGLGTGSDAHTLLREIAWPRSQVLTVVVGHQPTLGEVASYLMTGELGGWSVKKGAAWWFRTQEVSGRVVTELRAVVHPDLL